eukprot:7359902-Prymnesium_polylepis.1
MEETYFPGGLPDGVDIEGGMHAMDVSDVQMDGSRKTGNFYGGPIGMSKELRGSPDVRAPHGVSAHEEAPRYGRCVPQVPMSACRHSHPLTTSHSHPLASRRVHT